MPHAPTVEFHRHRVDSPWTYADLDQRQREIAQRVRDGGTGALLISEVAPVITLGRRTSSQDILLEESKLARLGIAMLGTDRGGLATYHGPGQWVVFAIDSLERMTGDPRGVRTAVEGLLNVALQVGRLHSLSCAIRTGCEAGVWTPNGKFAAVGVHIEQGILLHGLAINAFRTPVSFVGLRPCGLDAPLDFLLQGKPLEAREELFEVMGKDIRRAALRQFWPQTTLARGAGSPKQDSKLNIDEVAEAGL